MKKHDDYVSGPHSYWLQFSVGLVFGGLVGSYWIGDLFENMAIALSVTGVIAVGTALFCGRWGEAAWNSLAEWLKRWWSPF